MYSLEIFIYMFFSFNLSFKLVQKNNSLHILVPFCFIRLKKGKKK